jgi:hypothetical protein
MHLQKPLSNYSITSSARTSSDFETADFARIIGTPGEISFTVTPNRTLMIAETMTGSACSRPAAAWTDYFHARRHGKKGS